MVTFEQLRLHFVYASVQHVRTLCFLIDNKVCILKAFGNRFECDFFFFLQNFHSLVKLSKFIRYINGA